MAYGLKYRLRAETVKYKDDVKIYILEDGFTGTEEDKFLGGGGVTMTKDNAGVICGTSLSFSAEAEVCPESPLVARIGPSQMSMSVISAGV